MDQPARLRRTDRSLPIALLRAREVVMAPIRVMLAESGISEQKWRVLRVLTESGPLEQTALAERACLLLPSLTRMLRAMEQEGLVGRAPDPGDGRKSIVTVTARGRRVLSDHAEASAAIFADLEARFGEERLEELLDLLEALTEGEDSKAQSRT
ncbi:MAG: homoprotocatechuate degradation operon regulator HpaR [Sulfitobacter sp.]|nr:homoprotocatechuate degradation operon regulator HpaR [Sulfitobacter sp.]